MDVFTAATVGSANALGRADLGRIEPGAKADLVCVDLSKYHYGPVVDPIRSLITCGSGQDVDLTMVDGEVVVDQGSVVKSDEEHLKQVAVGIFRRLADAASERDPQKRRLEEMLGLIGEE